MNKWLILSRRKWVNLSKQCRFWSAGKYRHIVEARSILCYWAVRDLGVSMTSLAKRLKLSVAAITQSVERGERVMKEKSYHFP